MKGDSNSQTSKTYENLIFLQRGKKNILSFAWKIDNKYSVLVNISETKLCSYDICQEKCIIN